MQAIIEELARQAEADLAQVASKETLAAFWQRRLDKNGLREPPSPAGTRPFRVHAHALEKRVEKKKTPDTQNKTHTLRGAAPTERTNPSAQV